MKNYTGHYKLSSTEVKQVNIAAKNILEATVKLIKWLDNDNLEIIKVEYQSDIDIYL